MVEEVTLVDEPIGIAIDPVIQTAADAVQIAEDFKALTQTKKIAVLVQEKEDLLVAQALDAKRAKFYLARDQELKAFDTEAQVRLGTFQSELSGERTVIELKWKNAETPGTYDLPQ